MTAPTPSNPRKPNEIRLTRVYDAPVRTVWEAWTDPDRVAKWWGPRGFTLTTHRKALRVGGVWDYTMHGPDGVDYPNTTVYHEVESHRKLVYDHGGHADRPPLFRVTVLFSESDGRTTMEMTMALATAEQAQATRRFIQEAGGNSTWDRLAEYLDETGAGRTSFVICRSLPLPAERIIALWTTPGELATWLPPAGTRMEILDADVRVGGAISYRMTDAAGATSSGRIEFRTIDRPDRLVYLVRSADEARDGSGRRSTSDLPPAITVAVGLTPEEDGTTRVAVTCRPEGTLSPEQAEAFAAARPAMTRGWTESFDKLEATATPAAVEA